MSDDSFKPIAGFMGALSNVRRFQGECEKHGHSEIVAFQHQVDVTEWYCSDCQHEKVRATEDERVRAERVANLHQSAHIPEKYKNQRFIAKTADQKAIRVAAKSFYDSLSKNRLWAVLVLSGGVGTGKTLLASELAQSMIDKMTLSVRYCTAHQMIAEIQSSYGDDTKTEEGEILKFVNYDILIIDEIDAKANRENANLLLTEVINRRYNGNRPVVVITNQSFDKLAAHVGDRVHSRLNENSVICSFNWDDYRKQK